MKRTFIFALILLTTFSMVNALTKLGPCPIIDPPPPLLGIALNPDPVVPGKSLNVTISGKLNVDVPENSPNISVYVFFFNSAAKSPLTIVEFCKCKDIKCPVTAETEFSTVVTVEAPANLDGTMLLTEVYDESDNDFIACTIADSI